MWTQDRIVSVTRVRGSVHLIVRYVSSLGHPPLEESYGLANPTPELDNEWLKPLVKAALARLNGLDAHEAALTPLVGTVLDTRLASPTAEQVAVDAYRNAILKYRVALLNQVATPTAEAAAEVVALEAAARAAYVPGIDMLTR